MLVRVLQIIILSIIIVSILFVCRNLSKVIHRKDLPRIYTMCLPNKLDEAKPLGRSLVDLDTTREEVVAEVYFGNASLF